MPAIKPPTMGPTQYTHWFSQFDITTAGPNDRAGFMLAPVNLIFKIKILIN